MNIERKNKYLKFFEKNSFSTWKQLARLNKTSEATARRDMKIFQKQNLINIELGGVSVINNVKDNNILVKRKLNINYKKQIAKKAAKLIKKFDVLYFDAGTTTEMVLDYITEKNITIVTNGLNIAQKALNNNLEVIFLGGKIKNTTQAAVGMITIEQLEKLNITKAFLGTNALSLKNGFSTPDLAEAEIKKKVIKVSREKYVLVDSGKFHKDATVKFASLDDVKIISNTQIGKE